MKENVKKVYNCEYCCKVSENEIEIKYHEKNCKKIKAKYDKMVAEYQKKKNARLSEARKIASNSEAIKLLCKNGLFDDAKTICREKTRFLWDCGTSSGWENVYNEMIKTV